MLNVVVPGQAAEHHQGSQPQGQAVRVAACRKTKKEPEILVAGQKGESGVFTHQDHLSHH